MESAAGYRMAFLNLFENPLYAFAVWQKRFLFAPKVGQQEDQYTEMRIVYGIRKVHVSVSIPEDKEESEK